VILLHGRRLHSLAPPESAEPVGGGVARASREEAELMLQIPELAQPPELAPCLQGSGIRAGAKAIAPGTSFVAWSRSEHVLTIRRLPPACENDSNNTNNINLTRIEVGGSLRGGTRTHA
jgi:hypothetical protein